MAELVRICPVEGCKGGQGGEGGECIEGLTLEECPKLKLGKVVEVATVPAIAGQPEITTIRASKGFSALEVDVYLRERTGAVTTVALVGDPEVGKTTLLASIYELLRTRRMDVGFAGSETLRGFEERCHLSRTASEGDIPRTLRTALQEPLAFLHLKVVGEKGSKPRELIISDRKGEDFGDLINKPAEISGLAELKRFDVIALLFDAEILLNPQLRHRHIGRMRRLWMAMLQGGALTPNKRIQLLLTKVDKLRGAGQEKVAREAFEDIISELREKSPSLAITIEEVAARPPRRGATPMGFGLESLTKSWAEPTRPPIFKSPIRWNNQTSPTGEMMVRFDRPPA